MTDDRTAGPTLGMAAPLRYAPFRNIWLGSLLLNLGFLIQSVGAAWTMTELTSSASMVALVQTALMFPVLLIAMPAGAIADMYDSRRVAIGALFLCAMGIGGLFILSLLGMMSPHALLGCCVLTGCGMAFFTPTWQSAISDYVPVDTLPAAVALNSLSYNLARSVGPAIGGLVVSAWGVVAAFGGSVLLYLPMMGVLLMSRSTATPSRLPPESFGRAMVSGIRYIANSPTIRPIILRALCFGLMGGSLTGLMPLVARDLLGAPASIYGALLGAYGVGAVIGAFGVTRLRHALGPEMLVRSAALVLSCGMGIIATSHNQLITAVALMACGAAWMLCSNTFNIGVQVPAPRWVAGRSLATFQASLWGGAALGSWGWGMVSDATSVRTALILSAFGVLASAALGFRWKMQHAGTGGPSTDDLPDPDVRLPIDPQSGPVVIEVEYRIRNETARLFYQMMQKVRLSRQRNGAYGWSLARDMADTELWVERYHCPTWHDYLRQRNRPTQVERLLQKQPTEFSTSASDIRVRRLLERPFGRDGEG